MLNLGVLSEVLIKLEDIANANANAKSCSTEKNFLWVIRPSMIAACFHFPKVWEPNAIREAGTPEGSHAEGNRSKRPHRFTLYPTLEISSGETVGQMCWSKPGFVSVKVCVCNIACVCVCAQEYWLVWNQAVSDVWEIQCFTHLHNYRFTSLFEHVQR